METQPPLKRCARCQENKPLTAFHKRNRGADGFQYYCKPCARDSVREYVMGTLIPLGTREGLLEAQAGRCAVCKCLPEESGRGGLCLDHCHETNTIRGLLCRGCNTLIGSAKDRAEVLRAAAEYLERYEIHET